MEYFLTKDKFLTSSEESELRHVLKARTTRDTILIELALNTGMRASELLNIEPKHLDQKQRTISIPAIKGGKYRELHIKKPLFDLIIKLTDDNTTKPFPISYQRLVQIWAKYRPPNKSFHSLRHTAAMNLYKRTKDINFVKLILGHKSISTTQIYSNYDNDKTVQRSRPL